MFFILINFLANAKSPVPLQNSFCSVRFEVLMAVTLKSTVFWDVTPCSLVKFSDVTEERIASKFRVEK
jgi:hypothetical protein